MLLRQLDQLHFSYHTIRRSTIRQSPYRKVHLKSGQSDIELDKVILRLDIQHYECDSCQELCLLLLYQTRSITLARALSSSLSKIKHQISNHYHKMASDSSLKGMATRIAQKNLKEIEDLGDMRWELCAPIINAISDADQLKRLQERSPHLAQHTAHKWMDFILRDLPSWSRNKVYPSRPERWAEVYCRCKQRAEEAALDTLREGNANISARRSEQRIQFAPKLLVPVLHEKIFDRPVINKPAARKTHRGSAAMKTIMKGIAKHRAEHGPRFASKPVAPVKRTGLAAVKAPEELARLTKVAFDQWEAEQKAAKLATSTTAQAASPQKEAQRSLPSLQTSLGMPATNTSAQKARVGKVLRPASSASSVASRSTEQDDDPLNFWKSPVKKTEPSKAYAQHKAFTFKSYYESLRAGKEPPSDFRSLSPEKQSSSSRSSVASSVEPDASAPVRSLKRPAASITRGPKRTRFA